MKKIKLFVKVFLNKNNIYIEDDIFNYGMDILVNYLLFIICILPFSLLFNCVIEILGFLITFISFRQYLGGLHFKNEKVCFIFSLFITILIPLICKNIPFLNLIIRFLICFSTLLVIYFIGVIDCENKILDITDKAYFRKKAYLMLSIYSFIVLFFYDLYPDFYNVILITLIMMCLNLILSHFKQKLLYKKSSQ